MTQQTIADWLAAGNRITICPQCGAPLTGRARQVYCDSASR